MPPQHQSPPSVVEASDTGHRPMTYAQAAALGSTGGTTSDMKGKTHLRRTYTPSRLVEPLKEGRCIRCLARGHMARERREPIKCRWCRQGEHCQANCPMQQNQKIATAGFRLFACLVGELSSADVPWVHVLDGIQVTYPDLIPPDCHWLVSGEVFIHGLSKRNWRRLRGQSVRLPAGGTINWRRPRPTDSAFDP